MHTAPKYQNEAVIHRLTASGRVGTTATVNKRSRDPTCLRKPSEQDTDLQLNQHRGYTSTIGDARHHMVIVAAKIFLSAEGFFKEAILFIEEIYQVKLKLYCRVPSSF